MNTSVDEGGHDAVAVALGNASLLGVGYVLAGRVRLAAGTTVITAVLLALLATSGWGGLVAVVALWWIGLIVHGFVLVGGRGTVRNPRHRWLAASTTVAVLAVVATFAVQARATTSAVDAARMQGDCAAAVAAQDGRWFGLRVVDAPGAARGDRTAWVCDDLAAARVSLEQAAAGDVGALSSAQARWDMILRARPGHERMVETSVRDGVVQVMRAPSCRSAEVVRWFDPARLRHPAFQSAVSAASAILPTALVACGDELRGRADWRGATVRYEQALGARPDAAIMVRAQQGVAAAAAGQAESDLRTRLQAYCSSPFGYPAAPPRGPGGRVFIDEASYGRFAYALPLTQDRRVTEAASSSLVVCIGRSERGGADETCTYVGVGGLSGWDVSFYRTAVPVRVYETRSGRSLLDRRVEVGDAVCPPSISYTSSMPGLGPPDQDIPVSEEQLGAAVRDAVTPVVGP